MKDSTIKSRIEDAYGRGRDDAYECCNKAVKERTDAYNEIVEEFNELQSQLELVEKQCQENGRHSAEKTLEIDKLKKLWGQTGKIVAFLEGMDETFNAGDDLDELRKQALGEDKENINKEFDSLG